jgi:probable F420-dependent oxidoreductase
MLLGGQDLLQPSAGLKKGVPMLIDASLPPRGLRDIPAIARAAEQAGFGGLWSPETMHDPFLAAAMIGEYTNRLQIGTGIAVAFARSPATMAYSAWDLAEASQGRFILGLGTQVKAHIQRRFGMPWPDSPVNMLREQISALRAFWHCWQENQPLDFRGEYYKLSLMSPFFNPGPISHPQIPIFIAGVNTGLARLAGEAADGFLVHPFHTPHYLSQVLLPAIDEGAAKAGRTRAELQISGTVFAAASPFERQFVRQQIAFYASTPSYRPVMALHGWQEQALQLSALAARGRWSDMPALIDDEMLGTFAVLGDEDQIPAALAERYQGILDRLGLYLPFVPGEKDKFWDKLLSTLSA